METWKGRNKIKRIDIGDHSYLSTYDFLLLSYKELLFKYGRMNRVKLDAMMKSMIIDLDMFDDDYYN